MKEPRGGGFFGGKSKGSNWLFSEPKRSGGLMDMGGGFNFGGSSPAPRRRVKSRSRSGGNREAKQAVEATGRGLGIMARGVASGVRSGASYASPRVKKAYEKGSERVTGHRYAELKEKARRHGYKNLSHEEKKEYMERAINKKEEVEG
jgi:hypothetical protein